MSTTDQAAPTFASLRAELSELNHRATDRQIAAVLREWAADETFNSAPLLAMATLVGTLRSVILRNAKK